MAAATALIVLKDKWTLGRLRIVEALVFATVTVYLGARAFYAAIGNAATGATTWNDALIAFGLLMIAYGVFAPKGMIRAIVGVVVIGLVPPATIVLAGFAGPLSASFAPNPDELVFDAVLVLGTSAGVALIASFVIISLFDFAFEQRKRTFYDLERRLGSGGMGEVWVARHRTLARPTAVKLIREDKVSGVDGEEARRVLRRFEREAKATATLRSPHTIDVYDFGVTADGHFFYAMELLEGLDLEQLVARFGPVPAPRAVHFLVQACDSLADAHANGMTHRDIKPANLFLSRLGPSCDYIKLLDFGLVRDQAPAPHSEKLTEDGTTSGTPAYMAPEMVTAPDDVDGRADIYALGCVAYWLITGKQVFEADSGVGVIVEHVKTTPKPPSERTELPIPPGLEEVVMKCLEKNPADRFQSARELAAALSDLPLDAAWNTRSADAWWDLHMAAAHAA